MPRRIGRPKRMTAASSASFLVSEKEVLFIRDERPFQVTGVGNDVPSQFSADQSMTRCCATFRRWAGSTSI